MLVLSGRQEYEKGWQKMEAIEAILTRRSTRRYSGEMPERAIVEKVIEAGRYAPSGGNNQTKKGYGNALADSACALENMMIAANALDMGSCWINQLHWLDENETVRNFMYKYGLGEDETITGGLIFGYSEAGEPIREPLERKGNPVTWVEK